MMKMKRKRAYEPVLFVIVFTLLCLLAFGIFYSADKSTGMSSLLDHTRASLGGYAIIFNAFVFGLIGWMIYLYQTALSFLFSEVSGGFGVFLKALQFRSILLLTILATLGCIFFYIIFVIWNATSSIEQTLSVFGVDAGLVVILIVITNQITPLMTSIIEKYWKF